MNTGRLKIKENLFSGRSRTNSNQDLRLSKSQNKNSSDLPPINPETCLSRSNILQQDRQKRLSAFASSTISNDVSHILDSGSLKYSPRTSTVFKEYLFSSQNETRALPTGRIDLDHLKDWLEKMQETYVPDLKLVIQKNASPKLELVKKTEEIYLSAMKEIMKQVSVQSRLRGELIETVFETLKYVWTKYPEHIFTEIDRLREENEKRIEEITIKYKEKLMSLKEKLRKSESDFDKILEQKAELTETISHQEKLLEGNEGKLKELYLLKHIKTNMKDGSIQTNIDLKADLEKSFLSASSKKHSLLITPSGKEEEDDLKIVLNLESDEAKTPFLIQKENFVTEVQKLINDLDISEESDVKNLEEAIKNQMDNLSDWMAGFKAGVSLLKKQKKVEVSNTLTTSVSPTVFLTTEQTINSKHHTSRKSHQQKHSILETEDATSSYLLKSLLSKSESHLQKYAKNTKKKIIKHLNQAIYYAIGKKISVSQNLADLVLQQFSNKYNLKAIAERKFKELVVGCMNNCDECLRAKIFLCALGAGSYFKYPDTSVEGMAMLIRLYEFMTTNKTGIVFDTSEPLNVQLYPLSRAFECVRQLMGNFIQGDKLLDLFSMLKKLSENDSNQVNREGLIKLDKFVELALESFEGYLKDIKWSVKTITEAVTEYNYLNKREVLVLFRNFAPKKSSFIQAVPFDESNLINIEDFKVFCIENGLFDLDSVRIFFSSCESDPKILLDSLSHFEKDLNEVYSNFSEETLKRKEWHWKFQFLTLNLKVRRASRDVHMFHLLKSEFSYLKSCHVRLS